MGERRDGLCRLQSLGLENWDMVDIPEFSESKLNNSDEKIERMAEIYLKLSEKIKQVIENGNIPLSIAGDCVSSIGVLAGLQKADKEPDRIIWLDAHGDFHTWETSQTKYIGGMPLAMLVGRGDQRIVSAVGMQSYPENQIILSDARDLDSGEKKALINSKIVMCKVENILEQIKPTESLYIHFDTDVIDAENEMPALKYHVKLGPKYNDISSLFKLLKNKNVVAISVSAWHEEKDVHNKTAIACLNLLRDLGLDM